MSTSQKPRKSRFKEELEEPADLEMAPLGSLKPVAPEPEPATLFVVSTTVRTTAQYRDPAQLVSTPE
jgi:hypothetical protein